MKAFKFFFLLIIITSTISCSKDDNSSEAAPTVVGIWKATAIDYKINQIFTGPGLNREVKKNGITTTLDYNISFSENPNKLNTSGVFNLELETFNNQTITKNIIFLSNGTWNNNDNKLTITKDNETNVLTVVELTSNKLIINGQKTETSTQGEITMIVTTDLTLTFNRQ